MARIYENMSRLFIVQLAKLRSGPSQAAKPRSRKTPTRQSSIEYRDCKDIAVQKLYWLQFTLANRGLRVELPLIEIDRNSFAGVLEYIGSDSCPLAIYLRETRPGVYRQICCADELRRTIMRQFLDYRVCKLGQQFHVLEQDQLLSKILKKHSFQVDFKAITRWPLYSPNDNNQWNAT